jgi:hypothetical protein
MALIVAGLNGLAMSIPRYLLDIRWPAAARSALILRRLRRFPVTGFARWRRFANLTALALPLWMVTVPAEPWPQGATDRPLNSSIDPIFEEPVGVTNPSQANHLPGQCCSRLHPDHTNTRVSALYHWCLPFMREVPGASRALRTEDLEILVAARPEGEEQSAGCEEEKGASMFEREGIQRVPRPIETFQAHKV